MRKSLERLITDLNDRIVVVEGKRDVRALERIGVRANVIAFSEVGKMEGADSKAVILTDYDRAGDEKAKQVEAMLINKGIAVDYELRERFRRMFGALTIEEVPPIFEELYNQ